MANGSACKKKWTLPHLNDNYIAVGCLDTKHVKSSGAPEVATHVHAFCNSESQCAFNTRKQNYRLTDINLRQQFVDKHRIGLKPHWSLKRSFPTV